MSHVSTSSCSSEHPPVVPEDRPPILPPGPGVVRPDEGVQVEPHHPDRQRRPRGPSRPEEAGDAAGGARDQGERTDRPYEHMFVHTHPATCDTLHVRSMYGYAYTVGGNRIDPPPNKLDLLWFQNKRLQIVVFLKINEVEASFKT